jgi:RNA polymerase sigma-70 factor (ECF subfamily)
MERAAATGRGVRPEGSSPGAREAFETLALDQLPRLYSLARRLVGEGAEDLVQECLMRAYRSFAALSAPEAGGAWLQAILVNAFRDRLRMDARRVREIPVDDVDEFSLFRTIADEDPLPYSDSLHLDFLLSFGREDVHEVLKRLPEIYRVPLVLRYINGFATKEVARMLRVPLGTALARLHRGRKLFERELWVYAQEADLLQGGDTR